MHRWIVRASVAVGVWLAAPVPFDALAEETPLSPAEVERLHADLAADVRRAQARLEQNPADVGALLRRGTAYFHQGEFAKALADFDRMIELEPELAPSHWQRGITLYYLGRYGEGAAQFDRYHSYDDVDRENGIWRFLCQARADGLDTARQKLLRYKTTDRAPFAEVYAMFAGRLEPEQVITRIRERELPERERDRQLFYAELYVGLYLDALGKAAEARPHLRAAVANPWGKAAGGGPGYMWHVARLHYQQRMP